MSRVGDAIQRARKALGSGTDDDRGDLDRFFASGQAPAVAPFEFGTAASGIRAAADRVRRARRDDSVSAVVPSGEAETAERVPWSSSEGVEKLVVSQTVAPMAREQYNRLAAALHQVQLERGAKVVMVTSAVPGEGKTLTIANLAVTFSEFYRRAVLLIDADLRRPRIDEVFGVSNERGLSDSLAAGGPVPLIRATARLSLLTAGNAGGNPMKTLTGDRMRAFVEEARNTYDWILVDTAPAGLLPDAKLLTSMADLTLLIILAGKTPYDAIQWAAETLGRERIFGIVLNRVVEAALPHSYGSGYYYYYGARR